MIVKFELQFVSFWEKDKNEKKWNEKKVRVSNRKEKKIIYDRQMLTGAQMGFLLGLYECLLEHQIAVYSCLYC